MQSHAVQFYIYLVCFPEPEESSYVFSWETCELYKEQAYHVMIFTL